MDTDGRVAFLVRGLRARTLLRCANDANDLRLVWVTAREVRRQHQHLLGSGVWQSVLGSTTFTDADLDDAAVREVAGVTGLSLHRAGVWIATADTLCGSMPRIVDALAVGRLDLARATTVAEACTGLTDAQARVVEQAVLEALPAEVLDGTVPVGPWDVMSPRAFTAMVKKAVAEVRNRHRRRDRRRGPRTDRHLARRSTRPTPRWRSGRSPAPPNSSSPPRRPPPRPCAR